MKPTKFKEIFTIFCLLMVFRTTYGGTGPWPTVVRDLYQPPLEELASVLNNGLKTYFESVEVSVVDSPDLSQPPFSLAASGISGNPKLVEVGSFGYIIPTIYHEKLYDFKAVAATLNASKNALLVGAAGIQIDVTAMQFINLKVENEQIVNQLSYSVAVDPNNGSNLIMDPIPLDSNCEILDQSSLLVSDGNPGKVLKISVKKRLTAESFSSSIRRVLRENYPDQPVGLGGTFQFKNGQARHQVIRDYTNVTYVGNVNFTSLTNLFEGPAPFISLGLVINSDLGLGIVQFHFHSLSADHRVGGMYLNDTTPEIAEYEGYFTVAEQFVRVDNP